MNVETAEFAIATSGPDAGDRLTFTFFLACCFHGLLIFGIGFVGAEFLDPKKPVSLDVVLAQNFSKEKPKDPDFLAQANQLGGGTSQKSKPPRTATQAEMPSPTQQEVATSQQGGQRAQLAANRAITAQKAQNKVAPHEPKPEEVLQTQDLSTASLIQRSMQIAALSAELSLQNEMEAKKPRTRIVAPSTASASDAIYLDAWRRQVERVGNLNYPEEAKKRALFGELMMRVDINPNGTVREVRITQSSGYSLLDQAALRIVRMAAPFPPLPPEIRKTTDVLSIVRTWRFEPENGFMSQ